MWFGVCDHVATPRHLTTKQPPRHTARPPRRHAVTPPPHRRRTPAPLNPAHRTPSHLIHPTHPTHPPIRRFHYGMEGGRPRLAEGRAAGHSRPFQAFSTQAPGPGHAPTQPYNTHATRPCPTTRQQHDSNAPTTTPQHHINTTSSSINTITTIYHNDTNILTTA